MRPSRVHELLVRRWRLADYLHRARTGRTIGQVLEHLEISRATLYRDLDFLRDAGAAITTETVNGEARYTLAGDVPQLGASPLRGLALDLAIAALGPLRGSRLVKELTQLRKDLPRPQRTGYVATPAPTPNAPPTVIATLEAALDEGRELRLEYQGVRDEHPTPRSVRPQELQLVKGQLYLVALDSGRGASRTFKIARIRAAHLGPPFDRGTMPKLERAPSVVVWRGQTLAVSVRLTPAVARFATEFPLISGQRLEPQADGSVLVHADVAGDEEALRWVLSWGRNAEVVAPPALRDRAREELAAALGAYRPARRPPEESEATHQVVSRMVRRPRRTVRTLARLNEDL